MPVPETPVDENNRPVFRKHEIGLSGQVAAVEPEPESPAVQGRPDHQLRLLCFLPRIPAIIRLRTSGVTLSAGMDQPGMAGSANRISACRTDGGILPS